MKLGAILKWGVFNKGEHFRKGGRGSFAVRRFYNGYKNLIKSQKIVLFYKIVPY